MEMLWVIISAMTFVAGLSVVIPFMKLYSYSDRKNSENNFSKQLPEIKDSTLQAKIFVLFSVFCIPLISWSLYGILGAPDFPDQPLAKRLKKKLNQSSFEELIKRVEERLIKDPDDWKGWDVIAPIYLKTGRFSESFKAYQNAIRLNGSNAIRESGRGEALVLKNNGVVFEEAEEAFQKALSFEAHLSKALFFLGLAKVQKGKTQEAQLIWKKILQKQNHNDPWKLAVQKMMQGRHPLARKEESDFP